MAFDSTPRRYFFDSRGRLLIAVTLAGLICGFAPVPQIATAKAPPRATAVLDVTARAVPDQGAAQIAVIPQGMDTEPTGEAEPGFPAVYNDGQTVWVPAQYLSLEFRSDIDAAVAVEHAPLLDAPMRQGTILRAVPEGEAVVLTGAVVDGYEAASCHGAGGWILG